MRSLRTRIRARYAQLEYDRGREANLMKLYKLLRKQEADGRPSHAEGDDRPAVFSRILLNERARALRLTYDVFIYGLALALAVLAFVLVRQ